MKKLLALAATAAVLALAGQAAATEYVVNGGFEDPIGDHLAGWTQTGPTTPYNYVSNDFHTGAFSMQDGNFPSSGVSGLTQTLTTTAGEYDISLWWKTNNSNDDNNQLYQVLWDGAVIGQITGSQFTGVFTNLTYHVTGVGNDTIAFQGYSYSGYNITDDVSVTDHVTSGGGAGGVPEPASWALMLTGFFGLGGALRRRRGLALAA